ncbi:MAG TPA: hypothetical protein PLI09_21155 [Candidatus Hydrogenedentes bacterium]|nr:hypothetical protein [Candidatus Hydrogenedentota bacterium]
MVERLSYINRMGIALSLVLAAFPLGILMYKLPHYGLNFPYWDEMLLAPLIEHAKTGQLRFIELWAQHNEHRPLFPRLIMLALALPTNWNVNWVLAANVLCGIGSFLFMSWTALRSASKELRPWWVIPVLAFFVFSWAQMENWAWGLELTVLLCTFAVTSGIVLLAHPALGWYGFLLGALMGVVASYSFANGMLYWFAAAPALLVMPKLPREQKILRVVLWVALAFLVIESYFVAYHKPGVSPPLTALLHAPLAYIGYILLYLGSPVVAIFSTPPWHGGPPHPYGPFHFIPGIAGCAAFLVVLGRAWKRKTMSFTEAAPWLGLAAFAVGSALVTGIGRSGFGPQEGLNSRYMTTNALFWCALFGVLVLDIRILLPKYTAARKWAAAIVGALLLISANLGIVYHNRPWEENARWKRMGWQALAAGHEAGLYLRDLSWDPPAMQTQYLPIVKRYGLCGFGTPIPDKPALARTYLAEAKGFLQKQMWFPGLTYLDTALVLDPGLSEAESLRNNVPAEIREKFNAYNQITPAQP